MSSYLSTTEVSGGYRDEIIWIRYCFRTRCHVISRFYLFKHFNPLTSQQQQTRLLFIYPLPALPLIERWSENQ
jgi:hypothetical protein